MRRRFFLSLASPLTLAACGFRLRGVPDFAFKSILVSGGESSPLVTELKRMLASGGNLQLVADAAQINTAQVVLDIVSDQREKSVVGIGSAGQVREFQLRLRLKFRLRTPQGKELIAETELLQQRDISYNESAALVKESEENLLYKAMQTDIVQQLMRRLAAIKTL